MNCPFCGKPTYECTCALEDSLIFRWRKVWRKKEQKSPVLKNQVKVNTKVFERRRGKLGILGNELVPGDTRLEP